MAKELDPVSVMVQMREERALDHASRKRMGDRFESVAAVRKVINLAGILDSQLSPHDQSISMILNDANAIVRD